MKFIEPLNGMRFNPHFLPSSFFEREAKFFRGQGEVQIVQ